MILLNQILALNYSLVTSIPDEEIAEKISGKGLINKKEEKKRKGKIALLNNT